MITEHVTDANGTIDLKFCSHKSLGKCHGQILMQTNAVYHHENTSVYSYTISDGNL